MKQSGTLGKRPKRNMAKVQGLSNAVFGGTEDNHNGIFSRKDYVSLNLSSSGFAEYRKTSSGIPSSRTRPTRNPMFHRNSDKSFEVEGKQSESNYQRKEIQSPQSSETETFNRPYFFDKLTIMRLKQIIFLGLTTGSFPWKWNNNEHRIDRFSPFPSKLWKIFRFLFTFQTCCLTVYQAYGFWQTASANDVTNRQIFIASFNLMFYPVWMDFAVNMYFYGEQIREYINTLLKFNCEMVDKYVIHLDGHKEGGRFLMKFGLQGDFNAVFLKVMSFLQMPYAPWYLFSYIYPKPWYWLIPGAIQAFWFNGQVIASHTLVYWIVVAHANTMQFWLTEIHNNNNSDYTSDELRNRETSMEVFRSLKVLNACFNDCVAPLFIPIIKLHASAVAIICGYIMIRNMNHFFVDEFPLSLIFPIGFMVGTTESFGMLNMSSQMFDLGCGFLWSWSVGKDKDFRKTLLSLSPPKVYVRRFYFITVSTTIAFFKVLWDNITSVLLTFV